jgi:hypothetical protein
MNIKKPVLELDLYIKNNDDFNALFENVIVLLVEIYHYTKKDIFIILPNTSNEMYSYDYWRDIKDTNLYFKNKIFIATHNLMKIKVNDFSLRVL